MEVNDASASALMPSNAAAMPVSAKCDLGHLTARAACLRDHAGAESIMYNVWSHAK